MSRLHSSAYTPYIFLHSHSWELFTCQIFGQGTNCLDMKYFFSLILIIVGACFYYILAGQAQSVVSVPTRYVSAELVPLAPQVQVGESYVTELTKLDSGDQITTSNTGRALVKTGPQLITAISESSIVTFSATDELKQTKFEVMSGRLWSLGACLRTR